MRAARAQPATPPGVSANHHALSVYQWYNADRHVAERHAAAAVAVLRATRRAARTPSRGRLGHALAMQAYLAMQANDLDGARFLLGRGRGASPTAPTIRRSSCGPG